MRKAYISGKITGLPLDEARRNFSDTADTVHSIFGCAVVNPMEDVEYHPDKTWGMYMLEGAKLMLGCDTVVSMDNWEDSKGARIEFGLANILGLNKMFV